MKKVVLKKCSCSYSKKKRDVSGITPSSVKIDAVDKTKRLRALLFTHARAMALMHLTNIARARCLYSEDELKKLKVNVQAPGASLPSWKMSRLSSRCPQRETIIT